MLCARREGFVSSCSYRIGRFARWAWLAVIGDSAVKYYFPGLGEIILPMSHDLGPIVAKYPEYGSNLVKLAKKIGSKYPSFLAIDIGANIGDTARAIATNGARQVLCIEGARQFVPYLNANCFDSAKFVIDPIFVRWEGYTQAKTVAKSGSLRFVLGKEESIETTRAETIDAILLRRPEFASARLLKIDTDGLDLPIIQSNIGWISNNRPILFIEYLPYFFLAHLNDAKPIFYDLTGIGYRSIMIYDHVGRYITNMNLCNMKAADWDIFEYFRRDNDEYYADIILFPEADQDLSDELVIMEREVLT